MRWFCYGYFKKLLSILIAVLLIYPIMVSGPAAGTESKLEFWSGNVVFGVDNIDAGMSQNLLHQETLATTADDAISISFPTAPSTGSTSFSPTILQTSSDTVAATSLGFLDANYMFNPGINYGAPPVGIGQIGAGSPVTTAKFSTPAVFYPEMVIQGNLRDYDQNNTSENYPVTLPPGKANGATDLIQRLANEEQNKSAIGFNARDHNLPVILSADTIDANAQPDQINNTSIVERLWRNTHQGSTLNYAFEGETAFPTWIAPTKNPILLIDCGDPFDTIKCAMALTMPGATLTRAFWNL